MSNKYGSLILKSEQDWDGNFSVQIRGTDAGMERYAGPAAKVKVLRKENRSG